MLDTRKISDFMEPQKLIDKLNVFSDHYFSPWDQDCINLVITDLLKEHIKKVVEDSKNLGKLHDTMMKVGAKQIDKLLIMTTKGSFGLFERMADLTIRAAFGKIGEPTEFYFTCLMDYRDDKKDWCMFLDVSVNNALKDQPEKETDRRVGQIGTVYAAYYLFLNFVEIEEVFVKPKEKFVAKKYEGFKNMQQKPIKVADLSWARTSIQVMQTGVVGHLRNQPCGPGRMDRKLIYIDPFLRSGYVRKSGKERILKTK